MEKYIKDKFFAVGIIITDEQAKALIDADSIYSDMGIPGLINAVISISLPPIPTTPPI